MEVFDLRKPMDPPNGWQKEYLGGFEYSRDKGYTQYQMEFDYAVCGSETKSYVFITGTKDIWLRLGELVTSCHTNMLELLEPEFEKGTVQIIPVQFDDKGPVLISRTYDSVSNQVQYLFAPSR